MTNVGGLYQLQSSGASYESEANASKTNEGEKNGPETNDETDAGNEQNGL